MARKRQANAWELRVVHKLLDRRFHGGRRLRGQVKNILVSPIDCHDGCGSVYLHPQQGKPARVLGRVPVEASAYDTDGGYVEVLLHVQNGFLHELEIVKYSDDKLREQPDVAALKVRTKRPRWSFAGLVLPRLNKMTGSKCDNLSDWHEQHYTSCICGVSRQNKSLYGNTRAQVMMAPDHFDVLFGLVLFVLANGFFILVWPPFCLGLSLATLAAILLAWVFRMFVYHHSFRCALRGAVLSVFGLGRWITP